VLVSLATDSAPGRPNEDFAAASDDLVVVLDGATVPGALETGCSHGTRWFARALGVEIFRLAEDSNRNLVDSLAEAIKDLADRHAHTCDVGHPGHPSATVAILRETEDGFEYLVLADSTVAIETTASVQAITDDRLDHVATEYHDALNAAKNGSTEHATAVSSLTLALRQYRNVTGGYWVAAVDPDAAYEAITGSVARNEVRSAAIMTDGASIICDRFGVLDWPQVFHRLHEAGPMGLIRDVREQELSDSTGERWKRSKVHDDATAVFCLPC